MLKTLLKDIAKDDSFTIEGDKFKKLQAFVGEGEIYLPKSILWKDMSFSQRVDIMKKYIVSQIGSVVVENIDSEN